MTREELLKEIMKLPKIETNNPISTMNSINVDDLMSAIDRLNKFPDYNDLLKENQELELELSGYRQAILNNKEMLGLKEENQKLKKQVETYEIEGYEQNEELNKMSFDIRKYKVQQKEFIKYLEDEIETINKVERHLHQDRIPKYFELGGVIGEKNATKEILQKYKEIIGVSDENKRN